MRFDPAAVEGPYLRDLLAQPRALEDTVAALCQASAPADLGGFDRIVLTGMGASYHALQPLQIQLVEHGFEAVAYETSELIYYYPAVLTARTLLIAVSQSGRSVEIVRLLDAAAGKVRIVGVTNTPELAIGPARGFHAADGRGRGIVRFVQDLCGDAGRARMVGRNSVWGGAKTGGSRAGRGRARRQGPCWSGSEAKWAHCRTLDGVRACL